MVCNLAAGTRSLSGILKAEWLGQNIMQTCEGIEGPILKWRLCDELSVVQAALLIEGCDPADYCSGITGIGTTRMAPSSPVEGFEAAMAALTHAILADRLPARVRSRARESGYGDFERNDEAKGTDVNGVKIIYSREPDWYMTTVSVDDLREWLKRRGMTSGFFFPEGNSATLEFLDPKGDCYAPKLAAAVCAWQAITKEPNLSSSRSIKERVKRWLTDRAKEFNLLRVDGKPNEQGIEEIAKVVNWKPEGGAPKTPAVN